MSEGDKPCKDYLRDFLRALSGPPQDPQEFVTGILGYKFTPFHRKWWRFVVNNRHSLLLAPRGHGKSTVLTVAFSLYRLIENPELRILICSNTAAQAEAFLREIKRHLETNTKITDRWGDLRKRPWSDSEICIRRSSRAKEATVTAMGVMGPVISRHYDAVILDDVVDEEAARSSLMRNRMETWYYKELLPTLEPEGELHVIGTRYHHQDLYARLIKDGVPCMVDRAITEINGQERALWEEKFPLQILEKKRRQAGPAIFNAQYQNDVTAMRGQIFRPEWIRHGPVPVCARRFQGVDLAIGREDRHDWFAHVTIGMNGPGLHVLSVYRARLSFEEQFNTVHSLFRAHDRPDSPVVAVGIEANAYQEALVQRLRSETEAPAISVVQTKDKIARAMRLQGMVQTGRLAFPEKGAYHLIEEMLAFPDSDHDDLIDALEIAVRMATETARYDQLPIGRLDCLP